MNQEKIGTFIATCRKEHNMTQVQFAEKLGITNKAVSKWETGKCLPDATLFDDICILLDITLNELFAGERIEQENIEKKAEENLINMAMECRKRDYKIQACALITILLMLISIAVNISVGEIWLTGMPVFSNLLLSAASLASMAAFLRITRNNVIMQKISLIFCSILFLSSMVAFVLTFWDFNQQVIFWIALPCEVLFYGLKLLAGWGHIYVITAVLALIGLLYSKNNLSSSKTN